MSAAEEAPRPPAFVHVDCDGLWAVRSCYGALDTPEADGDAFWREGIPAALDLFEQCRVPATFFVITRDLEVEAHREILQEVVERGHEVASHTHTHRMDLRRARRDELEREIAQSRDLIGETVGARPLGFRAPGFSWHADLPRALTEAGYTYDSSLFPSPWGPAMRLARGLIGRRSEIRQSPYGTFRQGWASRAPHSLRRRSPRRDAPLLEIPISVTPRLRLPAHASFGLLRASSKTERVVHWHAERGLPLVWVIHLIDLCDTESVALSTPRWSRRLFCQSGDAKRARLHQMLEMITGYFEVVRTCDWVNSELDRHREA